MRGKVDELLLGICQSLGIEGYAGTADLKELSDSIPIRQKPCLNSVYDYPETHETRRVRHSPQAEFYCTFGVVIEIDQDYPRVMLSGLVVRLKPFQDCGFPVFAVDGINSDAHVRCQTMQHGLVNGTFYSPANGDSWYH